MPQVIPYIVSYGGAALELYGATSWVATAVFVGTSIAVPAYGGNSARCRARGQAHGAGQSHAQLVMHAARGCR